MKTRGKREPITSAMGAGSSTSGPIGLFGPVQEKAGLAPITPVPYDAPPTPEFAGDFMRYCTIALFLLLIAVPPNAAQAQPVEYVRICDLFGVGYFYIPGTVTCVNTTTGQTRLITESGTIAGVTPQQQQILDLEEQMRRNKEGVAMGFALPKALVDPGKTFGAALNVGTFDGALAIGIGGAFRPADGVTFNGALGYGVGEGTLGGNLGVNVSW